MGVHRLDCFASTVTISSASPAPVSPTALVRTSCRRFLLASVGTAPCKCGSSYGELRPILRVSEVRIILKGRLNRLYLLQKATTLMFVAGMDSAEEEA